MKQVTKVKNGLFTFQRSLFFFSFCELFLENVVDFAKHATFKFATCNNEAIKGVNTSVFLRCTNSYSKGVAVGAVVVVVVVFPSLALLANFKSPSPGDATSAPAPRTAPSHSFRHRELPRQPENEGGDAKFWLKKIIPIEKKIGAQFRSPSLAGYGIASARLEPRC